MKTINRFCLFTLLLSVGPFAIAADETQRYVNVSIDRLAVDTEGLSIASGRLAESIDELALAIRDLSANSEALDEAEKQQLLDAVKSVDQASDALTRVAEELPQAVDRLGARLPQMVREAREPIAELSGGLASARDGIYAITESLPQATANAKELVDAALDAALIKISIYTVILIAVLALALISIIWFVYKQYLDPLAKKLDALTGAPEHFASMALHMQQTSANLLALQTVNDQVPAAEVELPAAEPVAEDIPVSADTNSAAADDNPKR